MGLGKRWRFECWPAVDRAVRLLTASSLPEKGPAEGVALTGGGRSVEWSESAEGNGVACSMAVSPLPEEEEAKGAKRAEGNGTVEAIGIADAGTSWASPAGWPAGVRMVSLTTANKSSSSDELSGAAGCPSEAGKGAEVSPEAAIPTTALSNVRCTRLTLAGSSSGATVYTAPLPGGAVTTRCTAGFHLSWI